MSWKNKIVWVTGASSGIGRSVAYHLNQSGARVILSARNAERLKEVQSSLPYPECSAVLPLDLAETDVMTGKVQKAMAIYGRVDTLINNAGISQRSLIADTDIAVYKELMQVNYLGTVALSKALLPYFVQRGEGHFAVVTSVMGKFGSPMRSGYCAAKHALHGFFDVLRMEHEKDGVLVTMICPGFVRTELARNALTGDGSPQLKQDTATENGMDPDLFARKMLRAIEKRRWEVAIGGRETSGVYLKRFFPRILHRVVLRSQVV